MPLHCIVVKKYDPVISNLDQARDIANYFAVGSFLNEEETGQSWRFYVTPKEWWKKFITHKRNIFVSLIYGER